jgi:S1-C subfamily serine protease
MRQLLSSVAFLCATSYVSAQDLNDVLERATKAAVKKVSPSVVQIVTTGGADMVVTTAKGTFRKALGPTTGLIVDADGYIISSTFNFVNKPTNILVYVQGAAEPYKASLVASDHSRMLTLLKVDAKGLPAATSVPKSKITEGQWSIALGRTLDTKSNAPPQVSVGIISAKNRVWGKAIQTDAKISPVNYGGPLVDIEGNVQGILIPASPNGDEVTAGLEWYDSGIGFAIPLEDVQAVLPRLKKGQDLHRGLLGVRLKTQDLYSAAVEIADINTDSSADKAGLKPGDIITHIDGHKIERLAQLQHALGPKYAGDQISIKYKRGNEEIEIPKLTLVGNVGSQGHPFLGILPMRDDPKLGVELRHVFTGSPAAKAGLKPGDRIVKFGLVKNKKLDPFTGEKPGRIQLLEWLNSRVPNEEIQLEVMRPMGKTETLKIALGALPGTNKDAEWKIGDKLPEKASAEKALEPLEVNNPNIKPPKIDPAAKKAKPKTGWDKIRTADGENTFWFYVPANYDPNIAHGLVVWLNPPGKYKEKDIEDVQDLWAETLREKNLIMVFPLSEIEGGWTPSQSDFVLESIQEAMKRYTVDRQRIVAHGQGIGGQMAVYLGFSQRDLIRGVAIHAAVVEQVKEFQPNQRLAFYVTAGELDPTEKLIAESRTKLQDKKFSVIYRSIANRGREYLDETNVQDLAAWIDTLDKQ